MTYAPKRIWDFWPHDGGPPVIWREPCPFPADDADVFEYIRADLIPAAIAERDALRALLVEAASDLAVYVRDEYPAERCEKYPDIARRYNRDMELVLRIRAALGGDT